MKIVVTGASGFVGRPLVKRLLAAHHDVTALSRDVARASAILPVRCACAAWDAGATVDPAVLRGADAIVHLAGEGVADRRWTPSRKAAIRASRVAGAQALVRAIEALQARERPHSFITASAIGYYGNRGDEQLDEQSAAGNDFLADVCRAWEGEVFKADALGVRTAAVRIGIVLGKDGGALGKMLLPFRLGLGGRIGSGRQWMSWIHLEDLVELFRFVIEHREASGPINGVAPNPVTNASFTTQLARAVHRPAFLPVPAFALRTVLGEMSALLLGSQRGLPRTAQRLGFSFRHPDLGGALADLCTGLTHDVR